MTNDVIFFFLKIDDKNFRNLRDNGKDFHNQNILFRMRMIVYQQQFFPNLFFKLPYSLRVEAKKVY